MHGAPQYTLKKCNEQTEFLFCCIVLIYYIFLHTHTHTRYNISAETFSNSTKNSKFILLDVCMHACHHVHEISWRCHVHLIHFFGQSNESIVSLDTKQNDNNNENKYKNQICHITRKLFFYSLLLLPNLVKSRWFEIDRFKLKSENRFKFIPKI